MLAIIVTNDLISIMLTFDLTHNWFKIDIQDIHNAPERGWYEARSKKVVIMVVYNEEIAERIKAIPKNTSQKISLVGKECLLQGDFLVTGSWVKRGNMGKIVTLHLMSEGYNLVHGTNAVRAFVINNALLDIDMGE